MCSCVCRNDRHIHSQRNVRYNTNTRAYGVNARPETQAHLCESIRWLYQPVAMFAVYVNLLMILQRQISRTRVCVCKCAAIVIGSHTHRPMNTPHSISEAMRLMTIMRDKRAIKNKSLYIHAQRETMPQGKRTMDGIDRCHTHARLYGRRFLFASVYSLVCLWTQKGNAVRVPISSNSRVEWNEWSLWSKEIGTIFDRSIISKANIFFCMWDKSEIMLTGLSMS